MDPSPWARPGSETDEPLTPSFAGSPGSVTPVATASTAQSSGAGAPGSPAPGTQSAGPWVSGSQVPGQAALATGRFSSGAVTGPIGSTTFAIPASDAAPARPPLDAAARRRRTMLWFAGATGGVLAAGIAVLIALSLSGHNPLARAAGKPPDTRAPLAKLCPPPSAAPAPGGAAPAVPSGPRTVDSRAGISYRAYGAPWHQWGRAWQTGGELDVAFRTGQYFVTEPFPGGGDYLATILSGSVPAATNDALTLDLKCSGHQVAADVRAAYYPQPNTLTPIRDEAATLGGRPAWISEFRLHFSVPGLAAHDELVAVALIDVGRPDAAVLYVSIPGTHRQYDYVVDELLTSVRMTH